MDNHNKLKANIQQYTALFNEVWNGSKFWRVAIYVRLSKDDGNSVSLSIINQIKKVARYLRDFENFVIHDIYIDDGKTGTDFDRSDYLRLQDDIARKEINCIIVKDLTRYSRNLADGIKELEKYVLENNIRFISLDIPKVDTFLDPRAISSGEVYQALSNAEDLARITSIKVRDIKEIKREEGEKNGGFPPYGYLPNPDGEHWLYDPEAGEIVKQIFLWSLEGLSDRSIAQKLNDLKIPNPTAYKKLKGMKYHSPHAENNSGLWWPRTIQLILIDKTYIGCSVQGKSSAFDHKRHKQIQKKREDYVVVPDCHDKTVSEKMFEQVAKIRSQRTRASKNTGAVHIFANLVYCSSCNRAMQKTNAGGHNYLVCRTYKTFGKEYCDTKRTIKFDKLEENVLNVIQSQIMLVADLQQIVDEINAQPVINKQSERLNKLFQVTQTEIAKAEKVIDASYYDWKNNDISKDQYQRVRNEVEQKLTQLREKLHSLSVEQRQIESGITSSNSYFEMFLKYKNVTELNRMMLVELINRIYIDKDKSIKVEFNYSDQYQLILDYIEQNKAGKNFKKTIKRQ